MAKKVVATDIFELVNHLAEDTQPPSNIDLKAKVSANSPAEAYSLMMGVSRKGIIQELPIGSLVAYEGQPFKPYTPDKLKELAENIHDNGLINPIIVRQISEEKYQILAGHNRVTACKLLGMDAVPSIIKNVDDNQAELIMLDSNLNQRDKLLPSEKAFAYKRQMDTLRRQGKKIDFCTTGAEDEANICTSGAEVTSRQIVAEQNSTSREQIRRYIRLTFLIPALIDRVDNGNLPFRAGVNLSFLTEHQQDGLLTYVDAYNLNISLEQSERLKELSKISEPEGILLTKLDEVFGRTPKEKKAASPIGKAFKAASERAELAGYFEGKSKKEVENTIVDALKMYFATKNNVEG